MVPLLGVLAYKLACAKQSPGAWTPRFQALDFQNFLVAFGLRLVAQKKPWKRLEL